MSDERAVEAELEQVSLFAEVAALVLKVFTTILVILVLILLLSEARFAELLIFLGLLYLDNRLDGAKEELRQLQKRIDELEGTEGRKQPEGGV